MNYAKPAITFASVAKSAIQGVPKSLMPFEGLPPDMHPAVSVNAYEADE